MRPEIALDIFVLMPSRPLTRLRKICLALPHRFFVPPYVGPSGWVGIWLDEGVNWAELADLLRDAYILAAPKRRRLSTARAQRGV